MTGTAIPDFTDDYEKPKTPAQTRSDSLPDFTDDYQAATDTKSLFDELPPRLRGMLDAAPIRSMVNDFASLAQAIRTGDFQPLIRQGDETHAHIIQQAGIVRDAMAGAKDKFVEHPLDSTGEAVGGLFKGIVYQMPMDFVKFLSGVDPESLDIKGNKWLTAPEKMLVALIAPELADKKLTDEELQEASKQTTANVAAFFIGGKASVAAEEFFIGNKAFVGGKGLAEISKVAQPSEIQAALAGAAADVVEPGPLYDLALKSGHLSAMPWAQRQLSSLAGSTLGGAAYGYASAPEGDRISAAITMAMVAAPIGIVHAAMGEAFRKTRGSSAETARSMAYQMAAEREFNGLMKAPLEVLYNMDNLQQIKPLQANWARKIVDYDVIEQDPKSGALVTQGRNAAVVPGVETGTLPDVLKQLEKTPDSPEVKSVIHAREGGLNDVLIAPVDLPQSSVDFFLKTGFLEGQQITYAGNDRFVIRSAEKAKNGTYSLTLRNMVTDEHVSGVRLGEVVRPTTKYMGELALYQAKQITLADVTDPALGLAWKNNEIKKEMVGQNQDTFNVTDVDTTLDSLGYNLDDSTNPTSLVKTADGDVGAPDKVPLKPGINEVTKKNADGSTETGAVYIASNGQPSAVMNWTEYQRPTGGTIRRSHNQWHFLNAEPEIRTETTKAMAKYRVDNKVVVSASSLSEGGAKNIKRLVNATQSGRQYTEFGVYTKEAFLQDLTFSFLDHVGFFDKDIHISPEEVINKIGLARSTTRDAIAGVGETLNTIARAREHLASPGQFTTGVTYRAARGKATYTEARARELIAAETEAGHIPEVSTRPSAVDPITDVENFAFDDLVESWMAGMPLTPEAKGMFKYHLEYEMGRILTGRSTLIDKYVDQKTANGMRARVAEFDKATELQNKLLDPATDASEREKIINEIRSTLHMDSDAALGDVFNQMSENAKTKAVFEARLAQLDNPPPLDLSDGEQAKMKELYSKAQADRERAATDLIEVAHANGMYVKRGMGGRIEIRDMETHKRMPVTFIDENSARQWIKDTGGIVGETLDGGTASNMVSPESVGGGVIPNPGQGMRANETPYDFKADSWFGRVAERFDANFPRLTAKRAYFVAMDGLMKTTKFFADVVQPTQTAKMFSQAKKEPFRAQAKAVEDILNKTGIERKDWARISDYRRTMSVADIDQRMKPNAAEIDMSEKVAASGVDISTVYKYNRDIAQLQEDSRVALARLSPNAPDTPQKRQAIQNKLAQDVKTLQDGLNMDAAHINAAQMFDKAQKQQRDVFRLDVVTRRAKSIMEKEPNRADFAKQMKMTGPELHAANLLDKLHGDLLREANLTENFWHYVEHHLVEEEGPRMSADLRTPDGNYPRERETARIAASMVDGGQIGEGVRDPILDSVNLINQLVDHTHFDAVWEKSMREATRYRAMLPEGARPYAKRIIDEYMYGLKGSPATHDKYVRALTEQYMRNLDEIKPGEKPNAVQQAMITDISDIMLASSSAALLGGRPAQGARDLHGFMRQFYARFGAERTGNALRLAFKRNPATGKLPIYELAEQGKIPGLSILQFLSEKEVAEIQAGGGGSHAIRDAVFEAARVGLITSGQHNVYSIAHAATYLDVSQFTSKVLLDLSREKITKNAAYKKLKLDTYDLPVAKGFDDLVTAGKFDQATEYLAQTTGAEVAFVYGMQNFPYGWGSKFGRVMGQMGQWSIWDRDFLTRLASRGTASQRAGAMARYAMAEAFTWAAGRATGVNIKSWYGVPGIIFAGSPILGLAGTMTDMMGIRGKQRQRAALTVQGGRVPVLSQMVPGAAAFADYYNAYTLNEKRFGPLPITLKALGFAVDRSQRSWLDEMSDQYPQLSR